MLTIVELPRLLIPGASVALSSDYFYPLPRSMTTSLPAALPLSLLSERLMERSSFSLSLSLWRKTGWVTKSEHLGPHFWYMYYMKYARVNSRFFLREDTLVDGGHHRSRQRASFS